MSIIHLATSNPGKVREFREAAQALNLALDPLPGLSHIQPPVEDGTTFEQNARIKAEFYSTFVPGELVLAEDSGLAVDALGGAPGVYSARYAAMLKSGKMSHENSDDQANNLALITQLERLPGSDFAGKYVSVIALARDKKTLVTVIGKAQGKLRTTQRGTGGFGYDPLFYFPLLNKTFAELSLDQKREHSHRGQAFRRFLDWYSQHRNTL
jgi:XTP/dITP diphosphohydrolase